MIIDTNNQLMSCWQSVVCKSAQISSLMTAQNFHSNAEYVIFLVHERFKGICLAGSGKVVDESENGVISRVKSPFHPLRLE